MGPMVPGRIPWRDIRAWAEYHDMTADGFEYLDHCIREMDNAYLEFPEWVKKRNAEYET